MASNQKREETEALLSNDDVADAPEWDSKHAWNIVLGAGVGSFLEFYAWGLVSYFEDELKGLIIPSSDIWFGGAQCSPVCTLNIYCTSKCGNIYTLNQLPFSRHRAESTPR